MDVSFAQLYEVTVQVMKLYVAGSYVAPLIPDLGAGWMWVVHITASPFTSTGGIAARTPGGAHRRYGLFGEEKNSLSLMGFEPELSGL